MCLHRAKMQWETNTTTLKNEEDDGANIIVNKEAAVRKVAMEKKNVSKKHLQSRL